ncbi:hypothetical protein G9C85_12895 [Halorubellus sp. JP-L1]|uniref:hypothetical protein n=1 Tax=Halorubellus sp. JP-L1 TaxID=2715753 RepID=UPI00140AAAA1|nr:hypothetical protein [Halorubellus sp. JP-L1]NHN42517.1 hypothetical protein [Halorubellus sp. JP-L1]
MALTDVRVLDSITQLDDDATGVVVAASHAGRYAGYLAVANGATAVVLNDAGVGKDDAGIGSLPMLAAVDCAAVAVDHDTARIGDGLDAVASGRVSRVNETARALGCDVGQDVLDCVEQLRDAPEPGTVPSPGSGRYELDDGDPPVLGMDSLSLIRPDDAGVVAITGSHGARLTGERTSYIQGDVGAVAFNDAGGGKDDAGTSRLPVLADRGIPAVTVAHDSARIGDARSTWETGVVSAANHPARALGVEPGHSCREFAHLVREGR